MVQWSAFLPRSKKSAGFSPSTPASSQSKDMQSVGLAWLVILKLHIGVNMSVNGCLSLYVSFVTDCLPSLTQW